MAFLNTAYLILGAIIAVAVAISYWMDGRFPWGVPIGAGLYLGVMLFVGVWRYLRARNL